MPVVLVRHTRLAVDAMTCYGASDVDVASSFDKESDLVASRLAEEFAACDRIVSSPLQRCTKLAAVIADRFGIAYTVDPRIAEMDFGSWEGVPWSDVDRAELDAWAADFMHARPHGGDSVAIKSAAGDRRLSGE